MPKRKDLTGGDSPPAAPRWPDFRSPAFNRIDELQDCAADYRSFEALDGVVTADMRHRLEREGAAGPAVAATTRSPLRPPGHGAPGGDAVRPEEARAEPRFALVLASRCLRGRRRGAECARCEEACQFAAVEAADRRVFLDPVRCQGCGACALVCPADAVRMLLPSSQEVIARVRRSLEASPARAGRLPELTICEAATPGAVGDALPVANVGTRPAGERVVIALEHIGLVRFETLLSAFRYGAGSVVVACPEAAPPIAEGVRRQVDLAAAVLRALGHPEGGIRFAAVPRAARGAGRAAPPEAVPGPAPAGAVTPDLRPPQDAASLVRGAAQALYDRSGARSPALPLPEGAPFGTLEVAAGRCTSCLACAGVCPTGALTAPGDAPRLEFRESRCHQCGLCAQRCPEGALRPVPRLLCDPEALERPTLLHAAEVARCLACGTPFAPRAMVERMRERLKGHWMYSGERQARRLELCGTCRARDAFESEDVRLWAR